MASYGLSPLAEIKLICQQVGDPNDLFPKNIKVSYCGFALTRKEKGNPSFSYFFMVTSADLSPTFSLCLCHGQKKAELYNLAKYWCLLYIFFLI